MIRRYTYLVLFLLSLTLNARAQVEFKFGGIPTGSLRLAQPKTPGICGAIDVKGVEDRSSLTFKASIGYDLNLQNLISTGALNLVNSGKLIELPNLIPGPIDKGISLALDFEKYNIITTALETAMDLVPEVNCNYHILHCSGTVNAYLVTANYNKATSKYISGGVDFTDRLEIVAPQDTVIELPIEVSAALVAGQTFCNPEDSKGRAGAELTATLGDYSISIVDSLILENGEFLKQGDVNKHKVVRIPIKKGKTTLTLTLKGLLYAESIVKGISKLNAIACGSNAGAIATHSLIVKGFTGKNGGSLPAGLTIKGLITGIDYVGKVAPVNCTSLDAIRLETTNPSCGQSNGEAKVVADNFSGLTYDWDNGLTSRTVNGLAEGGHYVIIRNTAGCHKSIPFTIKNKSDAPLVQIPSELLLTQGDSVVIDASTPLQSDLKYQWSTRETSPSITIKKPGTYNLTVSNSANCYVYRSVKIIEKIGYWISDGNKKVDQGLFFDDGGPDKDYTAKQHHVATLCPATKGQYLVLNFESVNVFNCSNQDILQVFDGSTTSIPLNTNLSAPAKFVASSSSDGCLTVVFNANNSDESAAGWRAAISTTTTPPVGPIVSYRSCNMEFTDSGGKRSGYANNEFKVYQFCPSDTLKRTFSRLDFSTVDLAPGDQLAIYDGIGMNTLLAATVKRSDTFTASEQSNGCLTAVFTSDAQTTSNGWEAIVNCSLTPGVTSTSLTRNPVPANTCEAAPLMENYGAYKGSTSSQYAASFTGNLVRDFCGRIDNNSFYRFVSDGTPFELEYALSGGIVSQCKGVQLAILKADGECNRLTTNWDILTCQTIDSPSAQRIKLPQLIAGQEYFIMVDGAYGSTCEYALTPKSGINALKLAVTKETVICLADGSYMVEFAFSGLPDNRTYRIREQNNYYQEFKEVFAVNNGTVSSIKYGPYKAKRAYHILIEDSVNPGAGRLELSGESPCPPVMCKLETKVSTVCYDNSENAVVTIDIANGTLPLSIAGTNYNNLLLPEGQQTNQVVFSIPRSILATRFDVTLTDANLCINKQVLEPPICQDCPADFTLYPNPVTANEITLLYACSGFSVNIYNLTGQLVDSYPSVAATDIDRYSITIAHLPKGTYILQLRKGNSLAAKRFIKL